MLEGASSIDGPIYFGLVGNAHDRSCVRRPRPQPSRDRVNLLFYMTSRMACFSDVAFKGQAHKFSTFAHRCHRQQCVNVWRLLKSQADPNRDLSSNFWRLFYLSCHGRFRHQD